MPNGENYQYDPAQFGISGMSPGYLQSLMEDIQRRGRQTRGEVTARGTAAGMQYDDPSVAIARQGAISGTQREMGQTVGGFAYQSAQARAQREHELRLAKMRMTVGGGGGYRPPAGPAPYTAPTTLADLPRVPSPPDITGTGVPVAPAVSPAARRATTVEEAYRRPPVY